MDFDRGSRGCAALWNTQTAIRIQCLFSLQSKSIYPPPQDISAKNLYVDYIFLRDSWLRSE